MARVLALYEIEADCGLIANIQSCAGDESNDLSLPCATDPDATNVPAYSAARQTMNLLSAGLVANCLVTVRPCSPSCCASAKTWTWTGLSYIPVHVGGGKWVNACGCTFNCGCTRTKALDLGGPVAEVTDVTIGGVTLDPETDYVLEAGRYLHRIGDDWPTTQDMDALPGEVDTFTVTYRPGYPLGLDGERAYGELICEYAKSLAGQACALPPTVQTLSREGVSMTINAALFPNGLTGIRIVDIYLSALNPYGLQMLPTVTSPDLMR